MKTSVFSQAKIRAVSSVVPPLKKQMKEYMVLYQDNADYLKKLKELMGLHERYVADPDTTAGDLCYEAALNLFKEIHIAPATIDVLIFVTQTPDYLMPATAAVIQGKLGLPKHCAAFDVNLGCSGYVYGLWLAFMMIETGSADRVLLLAGDTMNRLTNPQDKVSAALFGDAGTATLIEKSPSPQKSFFLMGTDGSGWRSIIVPAGGARTPKSTETKQENTDKDGNLRSQENFYMNGAAVFAFSTQKAPQLVQQLLKAAGRTVADLDYIVFHQANKYIISTIMRTLALPIEKTPYDVIERYGNVSMASIPLALCDSLRNALAGATKQVMLSGFGVGLSWGNCLLTLDQVHCSQVQFFQGRKLIEEAAP